ncbi:ion channel [Nitzschia inconspicua]|uniref:Ion channel n=1 Tax=Nitzschia inconspicua TaxID=303405 RepID=A0A9K3M054_9STRA|nr:ion channel [Nitzschia inconspicua]
MTLNNPSKTSTDETDRNEKGETILLLPQSAFDSLTKANLEDTRENEVDAPALADNDGINMGTDEGSRLESLEKDNNIGDTRLLGSSCLQHYWPSISEGTSSCRRCLVRWPRTRAVVGKVFLLWALILWALGFGYFLSKLEGPSEVAANNNIMRQRWFFSTLPFGEVFVAVNYLPSLCMERFIEINSLRNAFLNTSLNDSNIFYPNSKENATSELVETLLSSHFSNLTFPEVPSLPNVTTVEDILKELEHYLEKCEDLALNIMKFALNVSKDVAEHDLDLTRDTLVVTNPLSFNWNRCWDNTILGNPNPWSPTAAQINASANQDLFFRQQWSASQQRLLREYTTERGCSTLRDNTTLSECILNATIDSVVNADGGANCDPNTGASAWFWFTVMTTVGYGNQTPSTDGGRALVAALGWLSIIAFGAIIYYSTENWTAIVDDFLFRVNLNWLTHPTFAVPFWAIISCAWFVRIAASARTFWAERVPGFEFTTGDSIWFAYISTLTVGLGDFYLQPQGMFLSDVFSWSSQMLTGFAFVSIFLGKVGDLITSFLPTKSESLADYLKRTDGCTGKVIELPQSKSLKMLQEVAQEEEGEEITEVHDSFNMGLDEKSCYDHQLAILQQKRELLIRMLNANQTGMDQWLAKSGDMDEISNNVDVRHGTFVSGRSSSRQKTEQPVERATEP